MGNVIRVVKSGNFSMLSNYHLKDRSLSWSAKGLLSTILAFSGEYTIDELEGLSPNGIYGTDEFAELNRHGYLTWQQRCDDSGCSLLEYTIYEKPISSHSSSDPVTEIMDPEDMPGSPKDINEEEKRKLRERLAVDKLEEKYSSNFVELVFHELCRREADCRKMMTAKAFEKVCFTIWSLRNRDEIKSRICEMIGTAFDNVMLGLKLEKETSFSGRIEDVVNMRQYT